MVAGMCHCNGIYRMCDVYGEECFGQKIVYNCAKQGFPTTSLSRKKKNNLWGNIYSGSPIRKKFQS